MEATRPAIDSSISNGNGTIPVQHPTKILETDICKVWYCFENELSDLEGMGTYYFHFESPLAIGSAKK